MFLIYYNIPFDTISSEKNNSNNHFKKIITFCRIPNRNWPIVSPDTQNPELHSELNVDI